MIKGILGGLGRQKKYRKEDKLIVTGIHTDGIMAGKRTRTLVYPHVAASLSEESFVDNSYSNDSSDSGIRDILGIKHIHQMTRNSLLCEGSKSHSILGTVVKAEHQNGGYGDSFMPNVMGDVEKAESTDHSEFGSCHKHNRKKKLKKSTKADALSDVEETNALDCDELISSHKPKGKNKSRKLRKSEPLSNVEETFADSLECSAMVNSHKKRNRMKKSRTFPQFDTLSNVTNWVLETDSLEHDDTLLLVDSVSSHKSKKKSSKSDTLLSVEEMDILDRDISVGSHKHKRKKKSRKFAQSDTLSDVEETSCVDGSALVNSDKQKEEKKLDTFFQSGNLSDVTDLLQDADSVTNDSQLLSVPDSVIPPKTKKKSRKLAKSDMLPDETDLMLEAESLIYNDTQTLDDSVKTHKSKTKSRKFTKSHTLSSVEQTEVLDHNASHSSCKHKRKKKSRKFAQSDTLSDVEETSCVDGSALVNARKQKEEMKLDTFFQSGILSDVTRWVLEADSLEYNDTQAAVESVNSHKSKKKSRKLTKSDTLSDVEETEILGHDASIDSHRHKSKTKSRKLAQTDHLSKTEEPETSQCNVLHSEHVPVCDPTTLMQQADSLSSNPSSPEKVPAQLTSRRHKRKKRTLADPNKLSDVTSWVLEPGRYNDSESLCVPHSDRAELMPKSDRIDCNDLLIDSVSCPESNTEPTKLPPSESFFSVEEMVIVECSTPISSHKHKRKKKCTNLPQSGPLSDIKETDTLECSVLHSAQVHAPGSSHKHKKKERKLTKSYTSDGADLAQEGDILDYSDSQSLIVSVRSPERKKKPRKLTKSDKSDGTDLVKEADILDFNDSHPLIDSLSSPKGKNEPKKLTRSELFSNMEEMDSVDCNVSVSSRKHKGQKRKLTKSAGTGFVQEGDILDYNNSQLLINAVSSPERKKKKPRKLTKSDMSDDTRLVQEAEFLDYNNSQSLIDTVSSPHKSKKKSRKLTTSDTERTDMVQESETLDYNQSQSLISSRRKKKQTTQTKVIQSETLSNKEETDCSDTQSSHVAALVSSHKEKTKKKSSKSPCSETMSDVEEADSLVPEATSTRKPKRKNKSRTRVQPETSEAIVYSEENDDANSQSQLCVSVNFQPASRKKKSKSDRKLAVRRESNEMVELVEVTGHAVTRGSESMSDDDIFRRDGHLVSVRMACPTKRCDSITSSINSTLERAWLVKKLQEVTDDDEKFADILHTYETNISAPRYKNTKRILQEEGLHVNAQNWTISEDQQLKTNWESFQQLYPEVKVEKMLSCNSWEDKTNIQRIIRETDFYVQLGVNIRRYLCQIYKHARVTLIQRQRRPGKEINPMLMELHKQHSNKWSVIAKKIGTTERLVSYRLKPKENPYKKGLWSAKEDECLIGAVSNTVGDRYMELDKSKFYWPKIAEGVPGRDAEQCYSHWFCVIHLRLKRGLDGVSRGVRKRQTYSFSNKQLIESIDSSVIDTTCHINWTKVRELMDRSLPITVFQHRWYSLVRNIPGHRKTFTEIIEHLRQRGAETRMTKPTPGRGKDTSTSSIHSDDDEHRIHSDDDEHRIHSDGDEHRIHSDGDGHRILSDGDEHRIYSDDDEHRIHSDDDEHRIHSDDDEHRIHNDDDEHHIHSDDDEHRIHSDDERPIHSDSEHTIDSDDEHPIHSDSEHTIHSD